MKDQYFGDINDYRKYGLLRAIAKSSGLRIGVCWMRTANDGSTDGEFRKYLRDPHRYRGSDPGLFDALTQLLKPDVVRRTEHAERWDLVPGSSYHGMALSDDARGRTEYFRVALRQLSDCPLIFFDPDNGIEVPSLGYGRKDSSKYVYWRELKQAVDAGHSVLVYQHFKREQRTGFVARIAAEFRSRLGVAQVDSFVTSNVVFFLAARTDHAAQLAAVPEMLTARWPGQMTHANG